MKIFMIGGTGLLGFEAAVELIKRKHSVTTLALPPVPSAVNFPEELEIKFGNFLDMPDKEILSHMEGCQGFIFAAGIDERVEGPPPVYDMYKKFNIDALGKLLKLAKKAGIKHSVICGSYFSYFARKWPDKELTKWHPYIRSRVHQEELCLSYADEKFDVSILQIPYVFGAQPGRNPVWLFLVEQLRKMKKSTLYPGGGTTMLTARQVGQAMAGALERNKGGKAYPLGYFNMSWVEMLKIFHRYMGTPAKKIKTIPDWIYAMGGRQLLKNQKHTGIEGGLHPVKFTAIQCSSTFIDRSVACDFLGVEEDDIDTAIGESVSLCLDIIERNTEAIGMKAE